MNVEKWKLTTRLWLLVGMSWLVGISSISFLLFRLHSTSNNYDRIFVTQMREQKLVRSLQVTFKKQVQAWKDVLLRGHEAAALTKYRVELEQYKSAVRQLTADLIASSDDTKAKDLLRQFHDANEKLIADYDAGLAWFVQAHGANQHDVDTSVKGRDRAPTDLVDKVADVMSERTSEQAKQESKVIVTVAGVCLAGFLVLVALSIYVVRGLIRALTQATITARSTAAQILAAANQVASASQSLAQGTSEQAASLEETSAASQHIQALAVKNANRCQDATDVVSRADAGFTDARVALDEMVQAISAIRTSNDSMSKIVKVVEEIAFQTNILALNAAVEAARAGSAGAGFAVVADEVRNLAQRCADATKDITSLIDASILNSGNGDAKVKRTSQAIGAMAVEIVKVHDSVGEIRIASDKQASDIEQVSRAVAQMEQVTQGSAANAEQTAAASQELTAQAHTLNGVVDELALLVGRA